MSDVDLSPKSKSYRVRKSNEKKDSPNNLGSLLHRKLSLSRKKLQKQYDNLFTEKVLHLRKVPKSSHTKALTEPKTLSPQSKNRAISTECGQEKSSLSPKPRLLKKYSEQNPAFNLQRTYLKFHQLSDELPLLTTKKFKDFSYKDRYYDVHRRLLQQTNIPLAADSWIAFDYNQKKYIRGWKVQELHQGYNLTKLLLVYTLCKVLEKFQLDIRKVKIKLKIKQDKSQQKRILHHGIISFKKDTVIGMYDSVFALMMTNSEEIFEHLVIHTGYLIRSQQQKTINLLSQALILTLPDLLAQSISNFRNTFYEQMANSLNHLNMHNTTISALQQFEVKTCAIDLCILFNACMQIPWFHEMFTARSYSNIIRYQLGYHFSQDRKMKWVNAVHFPKGFEGTVEAWRENNGINTNTVIGLHQQTKILVVVVESRQAAKDMTRIVEWCIRNMKGCGTKSYLQQCRETFNGSVKKLRCCHEH